MSVLARSEQTAETSQLRNRKPATVVALVVFLGILTIGTFEAARAMITDPLTPLGITTEWLEKTPVDTYFWPGMFFVGMTLASIVTIVGLVFGWEWKWARRIESRIGYRWPWLGALSTGVVLLIFEVIELFLVPFHPVMHPLLILWSLTIIGLPLTRSARSYLSVS
jgi:hypothetical protein